jgi:hypothetical protein
LDGVIAIRAQAFDGCHHLAGRVGDRRYSGPNRNTVDVDRTSAADAPTAAVFRSGQVKLIAQEPEEWHCGIALKLSSFAVDGNLRHSDTLLYDWRLERRGFMQVF